MRSQFQDRRLQRAHGHLGSDAWGNAQRDMMTGSRRRRLSARWHAHDEGLRADDSLLDGYGRGEGPARIVLPIGEGGTVSKRTERPVVISTFFFEASMSSVSGQFADTVILSVTLLNA